MQSKKCAVVALLVVCAASASAQRFTTYRDTFVADPFGDYLALGFGRGGDVVIDPPAKQLRFAADGVGALDAATPGVLPFTFHDVWKLNGLAAGTYSLATTVNAFTHTSFGLVQLVWSDNGSLGLFDFEISPDLKSAQGNGTFTVGDGCIVNACVNLQIYGWDDGLGVPGSGYRPLTPLGVSPVPEPTTGAMLLAGLGVLGWLARRRRA